jgi:DNA-directed RNA polymerase specialized sigma24 family protein
MRSKACADRPRALGLVWHYVASAATSAFSGADRHPTICGWPIKPSPARSTVISALREKRVLVSGLIEKLERKLEQHPKQEAVIAMLRRPEGATVDEVASLMGWQRHTVRGLFSGTLKKKLGLTLASAQEERGRVYRIAAPEQA